MKTIEEIKKSMPEGLVVWCENALQECIKEYGIEQLGEEEYNKLSSDEGDEPNNLDALSQDLVRGFWFAVELFNMNFNDQNN
jgi:hypothetical protein